MNESDAEEDIEKFAGTIGDAMAYVANEAILLARMEEFFSPKPARLWAESEEDYFTKKLDKAVENMGGPPRLILMKTDEPPPQCDTYPEAVLREVITAFQRARKSVCRAHMFMIGAKMQREHPDWLGLTPDNDNLLKFHEISEGAFWEHAETAYIRLASYWDRVGQVLDFAFFKIRQFERDGFAAVADRIRTNVIQMNTNLGSSGSWKAIRAYQTSEKDDGLKWLLRRRNITVHSLHLRAVDKTTDEVAFSPMYNHLEEKLNARLAPRSPLDEVEQLHVHLSKAATLFREILNVVEYAHHLYKSDA
ncbi:MAG: hypothetical protein OEY89_13635 [Gammaproteobacteria bacterium]|nr:hypothetical protein [Gammaproteobacteria bacterium]